MLPPPQIYPMYNNCEGGGKQAGGGLQFDTFAYENCEIHANGDKAYYDGFVKVVWERVPTRKSYAGHLLLDVLEQLALIIQKVAMLLTTHHRVHGNW